MFRNEKLLSRPYSKIETLFERDKKTFKVVEGNYRRPEFEIINPWLVTEKIDGTNIRLHFYWDEKAALDPISVSYEIGGRTERAQIQANLFQPLQNICERIRGGVANIMSAYDFRAMTIYGEGYGAGIQSGGGKYRPDRGFAVFDMLVDNVAWLTWDQVTQNCLELDLETVPLIGHMGRTAIVDCVADNEFLSRYGLPDNPFPMEGVVCRPTVELRDARNHRVLWKLKAKDFGNF